MGLLLLGYAGCARRAYQDLYIENMAAEIRELEDQLYEYDHEYRVLEQQLAALRAENQRLRELANSASSAVPSRSSRNGVTDNSGSPPAATTTPSEPGRLPSILHRNGQDQQQPQETDEFDLESLEPPKIEPGEPTAGPSDDQAQHAPTGIPEDVHDPLATESTRIALPGTLASGRTTLGQLAPLNASPRSSDTADTIADAPEVVDQRVTELAFHPNLSRAANFDDELDDDGLYLVLQPLNVDGQFVPAAADLAVVILDPAREGNAARLGRWNYSAHEVKQLMRTAGSDAGIHLTLAWTNQSPLADRVIVFARYTFADGRQVIGEKTFFVAGPSGMKTTWVPRAERSFVEQSELGDVRPAGYTAAVDPRDGQPGTVASGLQLVRPAAGMVPSEAAPAPRGN
ncbi:MAG: hypothetical protein KatS3mg111_3506 [Pirellulaceae bacterium]|nr:MAG: hypothetical protein KatS3mg111_3506 [Pirellulaceae bacterium]